MSDLVVWRHTERVLSPCVRRGAIAQFRGRSSRLDGYQKQHVLQLEIKRTMDGVHDLQGTVGILVLYAVEHELDVRCDETVETCRGSWRHTRTICLVREPETNKGVKRERRIADPRRPTFH
jgi:hypothetical protein